ncbi:hypothetical protein EMCG_07382 [[Emmonsia] crescens]|uniref:Uncharacterized protein n=1 Tax=[Emmonsia] crescens TaxID=73230 RepID=A0A0G2JB54_9EURO|nr:hypothetical protein EMCG_07382 [Emmonsia crescens UAMH 3008]
MHFNYLLALTFSGIVCAAPEKVERNELTPPPPGNTSYAEEPQEYATNPTEGHSEYGIYPTEQPADEYPAYPTKGPSDTIETYPITDPEATNPPDYIVSPPETSSSDYEVLPSATTSSPITPTHTPSMTPCISSNASSPGYTTPPQSPPIEIGNDAPHFTSSLVIGFSGIIGVMFLALVL